MSFKLEISGSQKIVFYDLNLEIQASCLISIVMLQSKRIICAVSRKSRKMLQPFLSQKMVYISLSVNDSILNISFDGKLAHQMPFWFPYAVLIFCQWQWCHLQCWNGSHSTQNIVIFQCCQHHFQKIEADICPHKQLPGNYPLISCRGWLKHSSFHWLTTQNMSCLTYYFCH